MRRIPSGAIGIFLLFAIQLMGSPSRADNTADEADLHFRRGVVFYGKQDYEGALAEFFQSNRLARNGNVIQNIARCYEQLKMYNEAYRYYSELLAGGELGGERQGLLEALARIGPRVALLTVDTEPSGAELYLQRKDLGSLGVTPKTLALPAGPTQMLLSLDGHREAVASASLVVGRTVTLKVPLEPIYGFANVAGSPSGAEIRIDRSEGAPVGTLPGKVKLRPGRHTLFVSASGYLTAQAPVEVVGDKEENVSFSLQRLPAPTGSLVVSANHDGALVFVDGRESGFTPVVLNVSEGKHRVEVVMEEMRPFAKEVVVRTNEPTAVKAELLTPEAVSKAASKVETTIDDAPASITVISSEELRAFGYQTVADALRGIRGFFFSYDHYYEQLGVRGFSPAGDYNIRLLVLLDGHAMNEVTGGEVFLGRDNNVDLNEIERIEVVRGPVSSIYGTAAFFGVVNLVPRKHLDNEHLEVSGEAGALPRVTVVRATGAARSGAGEVLLTGAWSHNQGDELYTVPPVDPSGAETLVRGRDNEYAINAGASGRWKEFSFLASFNSRKKQLPTAAYDSLVVGAPTTYFLDERGFAEVRWQHDTADGAQWAARAYLDGYRFSDAYYYSNESGSGFTAWKDNFAGEWIGAEARYTSREVLRQRLTLGLEAQDQVRLHLTVDADDVRALDDTRSLTIASIYFMDEARLLPKLLVNASVRADYYFGSFGLTVNPRLALIAKPFIHGVTKLMGGRSFRAPTAYERFYHDCEVDSATGGLVNCQTTKPSPHVGPEIILTGELQHTQTFGSSFEATGSVFVNHMSDLITYGTDPTAVPDCRGGNGPCDVSINSPGVVWTYGGEFELRWKPSRFTLISASYTYEQMKIEGLENPIDVAQLSSNIPAHAASLRAMMPMLPPLLNGSFEIVYNSARMTKRTDSTAPFATGESLLINFGLSGELPGKHVRFFAGIKNLLDEHPSMPAGTEVSRMTYPMSGRTFLVQLTGRL